jgi:hypothetical protein
LIYFSFKVPYSYVYSFKNLTIKVLTLTPEQAEEQKQKKAKNAVPTQPLALTSHRAERDTLHLSRWLTASLYPYTAQPCLIILQEHEYGPSASSAYYAKPGQ